MVNTLFRRACRTVLILGCAANLIACSARIVDWREEVRLSDGRTIVVDRKNKCSNPGYIGSSDCVTTENWLTFDLPEFSPKPIVWHETTLFAVLMNTDAGKLYLIGYPMNHYEYVRMGRPKSPYVAFVWQTDQWQRIPLEKVPPAIYDVNLFIGAVLPGGGKYLTLARKEGPERGMLHDPGTVPFLRRVDPEFTPNNNN